MSSPTSTSLGEDGGARVTLRDVASRADVHVSTVSRVLNGQADLVRISSETEARILDVAAELGYLKNSVGRALRTGRTGVIGMLVADVGSPFQAGVTQAAADVLADHGYSLLLANTGDHPKGAELHVAAMVGAQAEGFLYGIARRGDPVLRALRGTGSPVVLFNRIVGRSGCSGVVTDDRAGMTAAVDHLVDNGHRSIAHVGGPLAISSGKERRRYFDQAMQEHGLHGFALHAERHTEEEGLRLGRAVLEQEPGTTAIVTGNDRLALGVIAAVRALGLTCPRDVSVTGFNDMPYVDLIDPPLTTVRVSQADVGQKAATLLIRAIQEPSRRTRTERVSVEFVVRASTGPARARS